jgi:hypothetical protein
MPLPNVPSDRLAYRAPLNHTSFKELWELLSCATRRHLLRIPSISKLSNCRSAEDVVHILKEQDSSFKGFRDGGQKFRAVTPVIRTPSYSWIRVQRQRLRRLAL